MCREFIAIDVRHMGVGPAARLHKISVQSAYNIAKEYDDLYGSLESTRVIRKQMIADNIAYYGPPNTPAMPSYVLAQLYRPQPTISRGVPAAN